MNRKPYLRACAACVAFILLVISAAWAEGAHGEAQYEVKALPLERNGIPLHLQSISVVGEAPERSILLVHGLTYSSHVFDVDYLDYSLARFLSREGYRVYLLDIAGYGRSGEVENGFMPDSDYAAEDIHAAVEAILTETGHEKIDLLGWSWGTVTTARYLAAHPGRVNRYVMLAPILTGLGYRAVEEPFHKNTPEEAASDFQINKQGEMDEFITDPEVARLYVEGVMRYDGASSPAGGRVDLFCDESQALIALEEIGVPTLVIFGSNDPYLNYEAIAAAPEALAESSSLCAIPGAGHAVMIEAPFYRDFQRQLAAFLLADTAKADAEN